MKGCAPERHSRSIGTFFSALIHDRHYIAALRIPTAAPDFQ